MLVFTPERLAVMKGAPALRRRYLDRAVARSWPRYATVSGAYAGALQQRNQLLRRLRAGARAHDALAPWEAQLAQLGSEIRRARGRFVLALREPFAEHLAAIGELDEPVELRYEARGPEDEAGQLAELEARRAGDIERGSTSTGPHHDELAFAQGERDLRSYGSQGEQRSAVLALLTAEADLVREVRGVRPLSAARRRRQRARPRPRAEPARPPAAARPGARHRDRHAPAGRGLRSRDPRRRPTAGASGMMPG